MEVKLIKASRNDMKTIWLMQKEAFGDLLEKYQDHGISPVSESYERIIEKYEMQGSFYYFISDSGVNVGVIRIIDKNDGSRKRISPLWIMSEYRNKGYAQAAIKEAERIHGADNWSLDTILQEKGNLLVQNAEEALRKEGITKIFELVFKDNEPANVFWEEQGYTLRTNLNYRNKSLNQDVPQGE